MTDQAPRKKIIYGLLINNFKAPIERDKYSHFRVDGLPKKLFPTKAFAELAIARLVTEKRATKNSSVINVAITFTSATFVISN